MIPLHTIRYFGFDLKTDQLELACWFLTSVYVWPTFFCIYLPGKNISRTLSSALGL